MATLPLPPMLTTREAADALRVHPQTIRTWVRDGRLAGARVGHGFRIYADAVARILEQQPQQP